MAAETCRGLLGIKWGSKLIATELYEGQGLGNQLWAYAAGRSIAENLGVGFTLQGIERFKGHEFLEIDPLVNATIEEQQCLKDCTIPRFYESCYYDGELKCVSSGFDEGVTQISEPTLLEGLFQSERYFFGDLEKLKRYIRLKPEWIKKVAVAEDTCILNVRGGEYKRHKNLILPLSYWEQAIRNVRERTGVGRFLVVTDDVKYARAIFPQYEVLIGGVGHCYVALNNAKQLILSNSSFSYFPTKTNCNTPYVIAPKFWGRFGNSKKRWSSPANLYKSWLWQDESGVLHSYQDCKAECDATERYYQSHYFLRTTPDQLLNKGLRKFVPAAIREFAKRLLSIAFPTKFG